MKDHMGKCSFEGKNKKIKCQDVLCKEEVPMREMVQHLKDVHKISERVADSSGKIMSLGLFHGKSLKCLTKLFNIPWAPIIVSYDNQTFFLHAECLKKVRAFWVTILGNEDEAKKYEVELRWIQDSWKEGHNFYIGFKGKVFTTDLDVRSVRKDSENVLRLENSLAEERADGKIGFMIDYQITRK